MSEHSSMQPQALLARSRRNGDLEAGGNSDNTATPNELDTNSRGKIQQAPQPQSVDDANISSHNESTPEKLQRQANVESPTNPNVVSSRGAQPQGLRKPEKDVTSSSNKMYGWRDVYNSYKQLDNEWVQNVNEDISTLLLFAGLFATVLTAFLVEVYSDIQPDNKFDSTQLSAPILVDISKQLHALSLGQDAAATTVSLVPSIPSPLRVITTALWLLSLILSLGAALFGILVKQWVREYMRWTSVYPLQHALHIRHHRKEDRDRWHIEGILVAVWTCLVLGLILFFLGLAILSFDVNLSIAIVATVTVAIIFMAFLIMTLMPVIDSRCPYRSPFSSAVFIAFSYMFSKFSPSTTARDYWCHGISWQKILQKFKRNSETSDHSSWLKSTWFKLKRTWDVLISNTEKLWNTREGFFWMADTGIWSEWDKVLHLSDDAKDSVVTRWEILSWLVNHQPHSDKDSLIVRCFADLPGPPPSSQSKDIAWLEEHGWRTSDKNKKPQLRFKYLCQVLVHLLSKTVEPSEPLLLNGLNLQEFLTRHVWAIRFAAVYGPDAGKPSASFEFNLNSALYLYSKIQGIDPLERHLLLKCTSWLTETILNVDGQLSFETIDFDFFASLLTIYFMLVKDSDPDLGKSDSNLYDTYHRMMVNIISAGQPTRQRLADGTDSLTPMDMQIRMEFAGSLLYLTSSSDFSYTKSERYEANTIVLYMNAAVQFVERWQLKIPKRQDMETIGDDHQSGHMPTTVFWALATIVFDTGNYRKKELDKRDDYYGQMNSFIRALQRILDFETQNNVKWKGGDNDQRCEMAAFLILNYESIPHGFFETMKSASEKGLFDLTKMISESGFWIASPFVEETEWIITKDEYLNLLEKICNKKNKKNVA